jgi:hypothetical protein
LDLEPLADKTDPGELGVAALRVSTLRTNDEAKAQADAEVVNAPEEARVEEFEDAVLEEEELRGERDTNEIDANVLAEGEKRVESTIKKLFAKLKLAGNYGLTFAKTAVQESRELPAMLKARRPRGSSWHVTMPLPRT